MIVSEFKELQNHELPEIHVIMPLTCMLESVLCCQVFLSMFFHSCQCSKVMS